MSDAFETLNQIMVSRHSCRAFLDRPVPIADIEAIVALAQRTPSWCNAQPWQLDVTRGDSTVAFRDALLSEVAEAGHQPDLAFPDRYEGIYKERRQVCGYQLYEAVGIERTDRVARQNQMMQNFHLFGAPHVAIISTPVSLGPYGAIDCGGFVTAFTLAAEARGVASIPQAALASYAPFLHRWFDIPDDRHVVCAISFGYRDPDHPINAFRTERAEPDAVIAWHGDA